MSFYKKLLKNIFVVGSYRYTTTLIKFLLSTIIARLLTPEDFGIVALVTVFTGFLVMFKNNGLSMAIIRSDYGYTYWNGTANILIGFSLIIGIIICLLAYPISLFYNDNELISIILFIGLTTAFSNFSLVSTALLTKNLKFSLKGKITMFISIFNSIFTIILAYFGFKYWSLLIPAFFGNIISTLLYFKYSGFIPKIASKNIIIVAFKKNKSILKGVTVFNVVNYWSRNFDNLLIGKMYGTASLGIYSKAYSLITLPLSLIKGVFSTVLFPSMKEKINIDGKWKNEYMNILKALSFVPVLILVLFTLIPKPLINLIYGEQWSMVADIIPYFGILVFLQALQSTVGHMLLLNGYDKQFMFWGIIAAGIIVLSILYGSTISVLGIAQFYTLAYIIMVLPINIVYVFISTLKIDRNDVLKFWLPKIIISLFIWIILYYDFSKLYLIISLVCLIMHLIYDSKSIIKEIYKRRLLFLKK